MSRRCLLRSIGWLTAYETSKLASTALSRQLGLSLAETREACAVLEAHYLITSLVPSFRASDWKRRLMARRRTHAVNGMTYYSVDAAAALNSIRWKLMTLDGQLGARSAVTEEAKRIYACTRCNARWTQLDVIDNSSAEGFHCHRCKVVLVQCQDNTWVTKARADLECLIRLLRETDTLQMTMGR